MWRCRASAWEEELQEQAWEKERGAGRGQVYGGLESLQNGRLRLKCVVMEWRKRVSRGGMKPQ